MVAALQAGAVSLAEVASLMSKFHLLGSSDGQNDQQVQLLSDEAAANTARVR